MVRTRRRTFIRRQGNAQVSLGIVVFVLVLSSMHSVTGISILKSQAGGGGTHFNYKLSSAH